MDDECVEVLGKPISSLKVSELRDELAKRALIKTGRKDDLVDRLRQAIFKESTAQPPLSGQPADLSAQQSTESAIDYSTTQEEPTDMSLSQQQITQQSSGMIDRSTPDAEIQQQQVQDNQDHQNETEPSTLMDQEEILERPETMHQILPHSEESRTEYKSMEQQETNQTQIEQPKVDESYPNQQQSAASIDSQVDKSSDDSQAQSEQQTPEEFETKKPEPESTTPITFTLRRGNRDESSSRAEKRRKWSGKSDLSQINEGSIVSGGISSQTLQGLIEVTKSDKKDSTDHKDTARPKTSEKTAKHTDARKEPADNQTAKTTDDSMNQEPVVQDPDTLESNGDSNKKEADSKATEKKDEREPTLWLVIKNLMRPYTISQLKEELTKFGPIQDDKFWTDRVKSKCCVLYENIEHATQTYQSMQNIHWPASNPKKLVIQYITEEEYKGFIEADLMPSVQSKKNDRINNPSVNGSSDKTNKQTGRLGDRLESTDVGGSSISKRLGEKLAGSEVATAVAQTNFNRIDLGDSQSKELDDIFRKTKAKPQLFWLPLNEDQAAARAPQREERDKRAKELAQNATRKSPKPQRRRSPRRSPPRNRSLARRSPNRNRSPIRRRTPPPPSRRSPARRRPPPSPRDSPPRRRSPPRDHSPLLRRRASPVESPPPIRRRSPYRASPPFRRRTPVRDSPPPMRRRSPSPLLRRRTPPRDSPPIRRRSPEPGRRSPLMYDRRSPDIHKRSPGPIGRMPAGRRSPGMMRRSPGMVRRSPGLMRRSPGPVRRPPPRGMRDYDQM